MKILSIDTSGKIASVAIADENAVIVEYSVLTRLTHSQVILPLVTKALQDAELTLEDITAIAVANGPGSYTGLRIGIAAVKAMSFTLDKKCIGISTLESLAYNCIGTEATIISVMKARQNVVYYAVFESDGKSITRKTNDKVSPLDELISIIDLTADNVVLVGDYAKELYDSHFTDAQHVRPAPIHERLQLASSLCMAAMSKNTFITPQELEVNYLQITKAEKEIKQKSVKEY